MKTEEQRFKIEIGVAILTILLTPIFSGMVVAYQLSHQQSFTKQQEAAALHQKLLDQKIHLMSETVRLFAENAALYEIISGESYVAKLAIILHAQKKDDQQVQISPTGDDFTRMHNDTTQLPKNYAEIQSVLQAAVFIFGPDVRSAVAAWLQKNNVSGTEKEEFRLPTLEEVLSEKNLSKKSTQEFAASVRPIIAAMAGEVAQDLGVHSEQQKH